MTSDSKERPDQAEEVAAKVRSLLDEEVDGLDGATLSRLHRMRSDAVSERRRPVIWPWWTGAGATAAGLAVVAVYFNVAEPEPLPVIYEDPVQQAAASEMELMDDLDFVAWLVLQETEDAANAS